MITMNFENKINEHQINQKSEIVTCQKNMFLAESEVKKKTRVDCYLQVIHTMSRIRAKKDNCNTFICVTRYLR